MTLSKLLTSIMWPVEMSMLDGTGSSHQEEVLLRVDGLHAGPSLNWEDTLLSRECRRVSGRSTRSDVRIAIRWRHSSYGWEEKMVRHFIIKVCGFFLDSKQDFVYSSSFYSNNNSFTYVMCVSLLLGAEYCKCTLWNPVTRLTWSVLACL